MNAACYLHLDHRIVLNRDKWKHNFGGSECYLLGNSITDQQPQELLQTKAHAKTINHLQVQSNLIILNFMGYGQLL
jgi:hypothetical protein